MEYATEEVFINRCEAEMGHSQNGKLHRYFFSNHVDLTFPSFDDTMLPITVLHRNIIARSKVTK